MGDFLSSTLFSVFVFIAISILSPVLGYAFKKINENSKYLTKVVGTFQEEISKIREENASAKVDRDWIKRSLDEINSRLTRIQNHLESRKRGK